MDVSDEAQPAVEYVSESLDVEGAAFEAFSDVFARFQLPPDEHAVRSRAFEQYSKCIDILVRVPKDWKTLKETSSIRTTIWLQRAIQTPKRRNRCRKRKPGN